MITEEKKGSTWRELKEFINSIPDEFLDEYSCVTVGETSEYISHGFTPDDMYYNPYDYDDMYDGKTFKEELSKGFIEDPGNYHIQKKGTPFLTTEL